MEEEKLLEGAGTSSPPLRSRHPSEFHLERRGGNDVSEDAAAEPEEVFAAVKEEHQALGVRLVSVLLLAPAEGFVAAEEAAGR